jgi:hypothetical protein
VLRIETGPSYLPLRCLNRTQSSLRRLTPATGVSGARPFVDLRNPEMPQPKLTLELRVMAVEIVLADILTTVHRATADPLLSLQAKRQKFRWFFQGNRKAIQDKLKDHYYSEEIEVAVDGLFEMSEALLHRRDLA